MSEEELVKMYDTLRAEIFAGEKQLRKTELDLYYNTQNLERANSVLTDTVEILRNIFKAKIVSLSEFRSLKRTLGNVHSTLDSSNATRSKLMSTKIQLNTQLPKMRDRLRSLAAQLDELEEKNKPRLLEFKRNDKR